MHEWNICIKPSDYLASSSIEPNKHIGYYLNDIDLFRNSVGVHPIYRIKSLL